MIPRRPTVSHGEAVVLSLLVPRGMMYGLELVAASHLSEGSIYVTLGRMAKKGLIELAEEQRPEGVRGMPRKLYRATQLGEAVAKGREFTEAYLSRVPR